MDAISSVLPYIITVVVFVLLILFFPRYRKVPPNEALVISGPIRRNYRVRDENGEVVWDD